MDYSQIVTNIIAAAVSILVLFDRFETIRNSRASGQKTNSDTMNALTSAAAQSVETSMKLSDEREEFVRDQLAYLRLELIQVKRERDIYLQALERAEVTIPFVPPLNSPPP